MDAETDFTQFENVDHCHGTKISHTMDTKTDFAQFENMDTETDLNPFTTVMPKHHKSKGKLITHMVVALKKKPKKPQTNGELCSLFSPKQCNKSDSSSSASS